MGGSGDWNLQLFNFGNNAAFTSLNKGSGKIYRAKTSKWCRPKTSRNYNYSFDNRTKPFFILIFRYQDEKEELEHDISNAIDKIERWKAHILRAVHQDVAKDDILNNMTPEQALIMDWAMKFLPLKYRETQGEWFGKKGLSWHVTAVITKPKEEFEVFSTGISYIWLWAYLKRCMMLCQSLYVLRRSVGLCTNPFLTTWNYTYTKRSNCMPKFYLFKGHP